MSEHCGICQGSSGFSLRICSACVGPNDIRTFCRRCRARVVLTEAEANELLELMGVDFELEIGTVMVFMHRCPVCKTLEEPSEYPQRLYAIDS